MYVVDEPSELDFSAASGQNTVIINTPLVIPCQDFTLILDPNLRLALIQPQPTDCRAVTSLNAGDPGHLLRAS